MSSEADYQLKINELKNLFFQNASLNCSAAEMMKIEEAYELAYEAHASQKRQTGEPYIIHPISVARIVSEELCLGAHPIMAALLHDVVEDTSFTLDDIRIRFGEDVAFLVQVVTKEKKRQYEISQQQDNFKKMLDSFHYDIRALLIKLADRLHNMRTLDSMRADKQMKIACETDYFYAPLANRLGLYEVKSELENLSLRYRSPREYARIEKKIRSYLSISAANIDSFISPIQHILEKNGIKATVKPKVRSVYALWRKMQLSKMTFKQLEHLYIVNIVFERDPEHFISEKNQALAIYSFVTDLYKERPSSLVNYIDSPKENGYQGLHCQVMCDNGSWVEIHISSDRMARNAMLGCIVERSAGLDQWVSKFKAILKDLAETGREGGFLESIVSTLYNDDIVVFTPRGKNILLPKGSSAIDFAYEIHTRIGNTAKAARINGKLSPMKSVLRRGDRVEILTDSTIMPTKEWLGCIKSYKAKKCVASALRKINGEKTAIPYTMCRHCQPLPGDEVVGFKQADGEIMVHKRNCIRAISRSAQEGESIVSVSLPVCEMNKYLSQIQITALDRVGLLQELLDVISMRLKLGIVDLRTNMEDEIVNCNVRFRVHSADELLTIMTDLEKIEGVEEVWRGEIENAYK
ncbi:MAG: HD domain-containing protein [Bacteroidales bacterium]